MNRLFTLLPLCLALTACQAVTSTPQSEPSAQTAASTPSTAAPTTPASKSFSQDTLLSLLVAEIAGQREEFDYALQSYSAAAQATKDPAISRRAFFIAEYMNAPEYLLSTAETWSQAAPDDVEAQRAFAIQLASHGQLTRSMTIMEQLLQADAETNFDFLALSASQASDSTLQNLLGTFKQLSRKHPQNLQIIYGYALLLNQAERPERALKVLQRHPAASQHTAPLLLQASLLAQLDRKAEAVPVLKQAAELRPNDIRVRLNYARLLIELERLEDARSEFLDLHNRYPENEDIRLSLGLVNLDLEAWPEAEVYLTQLIEDELLVDAAHFYLGLTYEGMQEYKAALEEHKLVTPSPYFLNAQQRVMELMLQLQPTADTLAYAELQRQRHPDLAVDLYLLQVASLKEHDATEAAWSLINQALNDYPDDIPLLYSRAMLAESAGDLKQTEQDLQLILRLEPDNAMAMNALGYTLLEQTPRLAEAKTLIEQAHQLNPEEPATQDSLGWLYFKLNRLEEAEHWLRQAYHAYPDPEVAAHLAEVLWQRNKQREARKLLKQALQESPEHPIVLDTLQRLTGKEQH